MSHDIYIFGSAVRGEITASSDVDVLAVPSADHGDDYPSSWSVYSQEIIRAYYAAGRLFAWHLHFEAICIYSAQSVPFLSELGTPSPYETAREDVDDLETMLQQALTEIASGTNSLIFELGIVYTAVRDIAMSASWKMMGKPCFSRNAPYLLSVVCPLPINVYIGAMLARHISTRGIDTSLDAAHLAEELSAATILKWISDIKKYL